MNTPQPDGAYWDAIANAVTAHDPSQTWRAYMQAAYRELLQRWMPVNESACTLKTDLFEEAVSPFHLFDDLGAHAFGMDVSREVVSNASRQLSRGAVARAPRMLVADLRSLPFANDSFDYVLSGSSLDHFQQKRDIAVALAELTRCLRPGGCMVVTFDNPHNPVVRLRNALPSGVLARLRLVPYFVGPTYSKVDVARELGALVLRVRHVSAIVHVPRAPAI